MEYSPQKILLSDATAIDEYEKALKRQCDTRHVENYWQVNELYKPASRTCMYTYTYGTREKKCNSPLEKSVAAVELWCIALFLYRLSLDLHEQYIDKYILSECTYIVF